MTSWKTPEVKGRANHALDTPAELRALEAAAKETPVRLRNLEATWRQKRRASLVAKPTIQDEPKALSQNIPRSFGESERPSQEWKQDLQASAKPLQRDHPFPLKPIIAHPLRAGIQQISNDAHLIIHEASAVEELTILMPEKKVTVSGGGQAMVSVRTDPDGHGSAVLRLDLSKSDHWSKEETEQWNLVSELVARLKARMPMMKLYLPKGHLTLMSNKPPDLVFSSPLAISTTLGDTMIGSLRIKYSREHELFRSSLRLSSPIEDSIISDWIHVHRQLSFSHLMPPEQPEDSKIMEISSGRGIGRLSSVEEDGLRQIEKMRPLWETAERQLDTHL